METPSFGPARSACALAAIVASQHALAQTPQFRFEHVAQATSAIAAVHPPGDPSRMFITTLSGEIRIWNKAAGQIQTQLFGVVSQSCCNGLSGIAFHPGYATDGYIYLWTGNSVERIRAQGDSATPTVIEPNSRTLILRISNLTGQHVGGWMNFGADGYLWVSTGDGHNPANGQRTDNLAGRILRIDVDGPDNIPGNADDDALPLDTSRNYSFVPDNPFVGIAGEDEIWAYGLRNPFRCSFDLATGDIYIADVGEGHREEIIHQPAHISGLLPGMPGYHGGRNYGWSVWEGTRCNTDPTACSNTPQTPPVAEYPHSLPTLPPLNIPTGNVIIGGYVYRGCAMPDLQGWYIFGDNQFGRFIWAVRVENGIAVAAREIARPIPAPVIIYGFAQDFDGEVYACGPGDLYRILPVAPPPDANGNGIPDSCEPCAVADFNADGLLFPDDLSEFITCFFLEVAIPTSCPRADFNGDGLAFRDDLSEFITTFFLCL